MPMVSLSPEGDCGGVLLLQVATIANYEYGFYWYFYQVRNACKPARAFTL